MGFLSGVGGIVNDILGGNDAAKTAQKYGKRNMAIQNAYNKEMTQNAHQWEVADLQKAGLNPILSAGGSGAQALATGSGATPTATNGNIMDIVNGISKLDLNSATKAKTVAETTGQVINNKFTPEKTKKEIAKLGSEIVKNDMDKDLSAQKIKESKANEKYQNERARGFSKSTSYSGSAEGGVSFKKGIHGGASGSTSTSVSW